MPKNRRSFTPEYKDEAAKTVVGCVSCEAVVLKRHDKAAVGGEQVIGPYDTEHESVTVALPVTSAEQLVELLTASRLRSPSRDLRVVPLPRESPGDRTR